MYSDRIDQPSAPGGEAALAQAARFALKAPSPRNIQPWAIDHGTPGVIRLYIDRSRSRPVADPYRRELMISCGVALEYLELSLAAQRAEFATSIYPDPNAPDLLATLRLTGDLAEPNDDAVRWVTAAEHRATNWGAFLPDPATSLQLAELAYAATLDNVVLTTVSPDQRGPVNALIENANDRQLRDPRFRLELERWNIGRATQHYPTPRSAGPADAAGTLVVLNTGGDAEDDWLAAGSALARLLLQASDLGLGCTFMNQPVQVSKYRDELTRMLVLHGYPQQLIRVGHPILEPEPTPRRTLEEVSAPLSEAW